MAFEVPLDQIKQLQILLRKDANLSWYEPDKEDQLTLPKLPSVAETIANLDPSPPSLRCKDCKGRLLRGLESYICVFCGSNPRKDFPPDPIKFTNTIGYRWLLQSLGIDGSEMVEPIIQANESNGRQSELKNEIPLSELLDLEIRWPSESERFTTSNSGDTTWQSKSSLNLDGADLDSFFASRTLASNALEHKLNLEKQVDSSEENSFHVSDNLSLFQNVQAPETATGPMTENQSGDSFSGWEASFQSARSGTTQEKLESFDHSTVDLEAVFGSGKEVFDVTKNDDFNPPASAADDWFQGNIWITSNSAEKSGMTSDLDGKNTAETDNNSSSKNLDWMQDDQWQVSSNMRTNIVATDEVDDSFDAWSDFTGSVSAHDPSTSVSNSEITSQTAKSEMTAEFHNTKTSESAYSSTNDFNWVQNDQGPGSSNKTTNTATTDEVADSFDAWNDFASLANTQDPSSTGWKQTVNETSSAERASNTNLFGSSNNLNDMDFGGFAEHDLFSGQCISPVSSNGVNITQSEASISSRTPDVDATKGNAEDIKWGLISNAESGPKADDVEQLLSQMHDLSFMLESNLSIPPNQHHPSLSRPQ